MKGVIFFIITLTAVICVSLPDTTGNWHNIESNALPWFQKLGNISAVYRHDAYESPEGGTVCYRTVITYTQSHEMTCLGWEDGQIKHLETYKLD